MLLNEVNYWPKIVHQDQVQTRDSRLESDSTLSLARTFLSPDFDGQTRESRANPILLHLSDARITRFYTCNRVVFALFLALLFALSFGRECDSIKVPNRANKIDRE